jgi:prepilin-type N-terminal cleavage/methylation domain-containing protein
MKKAFTLLELVFVMVVIGILAATIIPRVQNNPLQEAAIQLLSHIRYTQHLAILDDKFNANDLNWHKGRWQLVFSANKYTNYEYAYTIFSDKYTYGGDPSSGEIAKNPQNSDKLMTGGYGISSSININHENFKGMKEMNLGMKYGIKSVKLSGGCRNSRISFDHLGRPMKGDQGSMTGAYNAGTQRLITSDCVITLNDGVDDLNITIYPETGYSKINF